MKTNSAEGDRIDPHRARVYVTKVIMTDLDCNSIIQERGNGVGKI